MVHCLAFVVLLSTAFDAISFQHHRPVTYSLHTAGLKYTPQNKAATSAFSPRQQLVCKAQSTKDLILVTNEKCPFAQRVSVTLSEMNLKVKTVEIPVEGEHGKPDWFLDKNILGEVPTLFHHEKPIAGSEFIVDFIVENFVEDELRNDFLGPEDSEYAQQILDWRVFTNSEIIPAATFAIMNNDSHGVPEYTSAMHEALYDFEDKLHAANEAFAKGGNGNGENGERIFLMGDKITAADVSLWPFLYRYFEAMRYPGYDLDMVTKNRKEMYVLQQEIPLVKKWLEDMSKVKSIKKAIKLISTEEEGGKGIGDRELGMDGRMRKWWWWWEPSVRSPVYDD